MITRIFISNNAENLTEKLNEFKNTITVEAEYGDTVVEGTLATLAHHGSRSGNPCPCLEPNREPGRIIEAIGVSHFDLDTLGGVMACLHKKSVTYSQDQSYHEHDKFWKLAAFIDTSGPHRIEQGPGNNTTRIMIQAFWAWSEKNRLFAPRDGSVLDCTDFFDEAAKAVNIILSGYFSAGEKWAKKMTELNLKTIKETIKTVEGVGIIIRITDGPFVNAMYQVGDSEIIADAVIGFNKKLGTFTLSFERPGIGNACEIMQAAFGPEAGGHAGIAGSPRDKILTYQAIKDILTHI